MLIDVAFAPAEARQWRDTVCVLVDVVRATTSIVTMFDRGCRTVIPLPSLAATRRLAAAEGYILAGERAGLRPLGFDLGNSPVEISRSDLKGKTIAFTTSNGTAALRWLEDAPAVLAGSLRNATACSRTAIELAGAISGRLGIVCSGRGRRFVLDDAACAGVLVGRVLHLLGEADQSPFGDAYTCATLTDAARAALHLSVAAAGLEAVFHQSGSVHRLAEIDLMEDLPYCLDIDASQSVPVLARGNPDRFESTQEN